MIAIIDYGMGNLRSVQKAFEHVGYQAVITNRSKVIDEAKGVVLPGVGAFQDAMENLRQLKLIPVIERAISQNKPFLGICLGLQLLFSVGEENGEHQGLDIFPGRVVRLSDSFKIPHMGWNELTIKKAHPILKSIPQNVFCYFVHSYHVIPEDPSLISAVTDYGTKITAVAAKDNVIGIQFHPEKSSTWGLEILKNYGGMVESVDHTGY